MNRHRSESSPARAGHTANAERLFPTNLPELEWVEFAAAGFSQPVCGIIHRSASAPCCGVPLGGVSTGCLDIEASGVLGFNSIFVGHPRSPQLLWPFLGLAVGSGVWVLARQKILDGGDFKGCNEPRVSARGPTITLPAISGVGCARGSSGGPV